MDISWIRYCWFSMNVYCHVFHWIEWVSKIAILTLIWCMNLVRHFIINPLSSRRIMENIMKGKVPYDVENWEAKRLLPLLPWNPTFSLSRWSSKLNSNFDINFEVDARGWPPQYFDLVIDGNLPLLLAYTPHLAPIRKWDWIAWGEV